MSEENSLKPRILAVDDSRVMRRAMSKILSTNYDVIEVENGEDAWTILINDNTIQIVFTDLSMPFLDGYGLLERIRSSDDVNLNEIPVIIITGKEDDEEAKQEALDKGANDFITKPFDSIQLQARAKAHITFKQTTTKLSETSDKLERQSTIDETTGLGGQRYFCKVGEEILSYANRHGGQFIISRMDIDDFNNIFIKYGKKNIDFILNEIGKKLSNLVRQEDTVARIGVSKFALLLKETNMEAAVLLANRIREDIQALEFKIPENGDTLKLTLSIGMHQPKVNTKLNFSKLVTETEKYLSDAISKGGNCVVSHAPDKIITPKPNEDINIHEILKKLKNNEPKELLPKVEAIIEQITPLLKFLAENARTEFQAVLRKISSK